MIDGKPGCRPPDGGAAGGADIDAWRDPAGGIAQAAIAGEEEMPAARAGAMRAGYKQSVGMSGEPVITTMARVDVQDINPARHAGRHPDQRAGISAP